MYLFSCQRIVHHHYLPPRTFYMEFMRAKKDSLEVKARSSLCLSVSKSYGDDRPMKFSAILLIYFLLVPV